MTSEERTNQQIEQQMQPAVKTINESPKSKQMKAADDNIDWHHEGIETN